MACKAVFSPFRPLFRLAAMGQVRLGASKTKASIQMSNRKEIKPVIWLRRLRASILITLALTLGPVLPHSDSCGGSHAGIRRVNNYRVPPPGHAPKERPLKDREGAESEE